MALPSSYWIWISRDQDRIQHFEQAPSLPVDGHIRKRLGPPQLFPQLEPNELFYSRTFKRTGPSEWPGQGGKKHRNSQISPDKWIKVCQAETDHSKISRDPFPDRTYWWPLALQSQFVSRRNHLCISLFFWSSTGNLKDYLLNYQVSY